MPGNASHKPRTSTKPRRKVTRARPATACANCARNADKLDSECFSPDGKFRYALKRTLKPDGIEVCFALFNSSTATAKKPDNTVRRTYGFGERMNAATVRVVNMYGFITPYPSVLLAARNPLEHKLGVNDLHIKMALETADRIIVAWGAGPSHPKLRPGIARVATMLQGYNVESFGVTKDGHPPHPLYLSYETKIVPYQIGEAQRGIAKRVKRSRVAPPSRSQHTHVQPVGTI